jgi:type I restriction enzyme S subunit
MIVFSPLNKQEKMIISAILSRISFIIVSIVGTIGSVDDLIENIESRKRCLNSILETSLKRYSSCVPFQSYHPILVKTGISPFDGDKVYLDTSCVSETDPTDYSYIVQYGERPSRANMQPSPRTAWTARMKASFKVLGFTELDSFILNNVILSTGFVGVQESENLPLPFLYALFISEDFRAKKDLSSTGATMESINNKDFLDLIVPSLTLDEAREYKRKYDPIMLELSSLREQEKKLKEEKKLLLAKYF